MMTEKEFLEIERDFLGTYDDKLLKLFDESNKNGLIDMTGESIPAIDGFGIDIICPLVSLMKKEFICIFREPKHLFAYFSIAASMPLMVYCCYTLFESLIYNMIGLEINFPTTSKKLKEIVDLTIKYHGFAEAAKVLDEIKSMGYKYSTRGSLSIAVYDMTIPPEKKALLEEASKQVDEINELFNYGA